MRSSQNNTFGTPDEPFNIVFVGSKSSMQDFVCSDYFSVIPSFYKTIETSNLVLISKNVYYQINYFTNTTHADISKSIPKAHGILYLENNFEHIRFFEKLRDYKKCVSLIYNPLFSPLKHISKIYDGVCSLEFTIDESYKFKSACLMHAHQNKSSLLSTLPNEIFDMIGVEYHHLANNKNLLFFPSREIEKKQTKEITLERTRLTQ